mmetsp:Transcript_20587/g.57117  ORF Transcript_20587/g.57117 Transcript_20587/m.57117 type:complete len:260 (-) Transcript_20587:2187-2966(-)
MLKALEGDDQAPVATAVADNDLVLACPLPQHASQVVLVLKLNQFQLKRLLFCLPQLGDVVDGLPGRNLRQQPVGDARGGAAEHGHGAVGIRAVRLRGEAVLLGKAMDYSPLGAAHGAQDLPLVGLAVSEERCKGRLDLGNQLRGGLGGLQEVGGVGRRPIPVKVCDVPLRVVDSKSTGQLLRPLLRRGGGGASAIALEGRQLLALHSSEVPHPPAAGALEGAAHEGRRAGRGSLGPGPLASCDGVREARELVHLRQVGC